MAKSENVYRDRDLSWLEFNERILQEAEDERVHFTDRLKFLAIYSSNLEEFYKVRVAANRYLQNHGGDKKNKFGFRPSFILDEINRIVESQQERLGKALKENVLPLYEANGVKLLNFNDFSDADFDQMKQVFESEIKDEIEVIEITNEEEIVLENQLVYLYCVSQEKQWIIPMDYKKLNRFIDLSGDDKSKRIVQLDDLVRVHLEKLIEGKAECFAVKVSRDAELYLDEEGQEEVVQRIKKSIKKRKSGLPARLLFDETISFKDLNLLRKKARLNLSSLIPGGRYHNLYDFFGFPSPPNCSPPPTEIIKNSRLRSDNNWFEEVKSSPVFLSFPYQSYDTVVQFLELAAEDPKVESIDITLYRVASNSAICKALEVALKAGKKVFVLDEVTARFDEESNIYWGERLKEQGATVRFGVPKKKVHAKLFSVKRKEGENLISYNYLGTGNFNEMTAGIYADHALITTDATFARDIDAVFDFLKGEKKVIEPEKLLVSPFTFRSSIEEKIAREIEHAQAGRTAKMQFKVNSLEDPSMIDWICKAAEAGVTINLIVRGICCYTPSTEAQRKHVKVVSIVDNLLEHTRVYHFHNDGNDEIYLASADLMTRNLSRRVEVGFPLESDSFKQILLDEMNFQLTDSVKGRMVGSNQYIQGNETMSSQEKMKQRVADFQQLKPVNERI
ncbi:MAG: polyphosphate kinase 1 [Flavobacteriales bacterium]|nr:polyphosphate kinase 1 [Flavobacteriales bacterium]